MESNYLDKDGNPVKIEVVPARKKGSGSSSMWKKILKKNEINKLYNEKELILCSVSKLFRLKIKFKKNKDLINRIDIVLKKRQVLGS